MSSRDDFEITDGVLNLYNGTESDVVVPEGVTEIGGKDLKLDFCVDYFLDYVAAFQYRNDITSVSLPNSLRTIGDSAFEDCEGLTSITLPEGLIICPSYEMIHQEPHTATQITTS